MIKKWMIAVFAALMLAAPAAGAYAQGEGPPEDRPAGGQGFGQVVEIGTDTITLENPRGTLVVAITGETQFRTQDGEPAALSDLEVGRWVVGRGERAEDGTLTARLVVLLPEDFDPSEAGLRRVNGVIEQVNNGQGTFTLALEDGQSLTVQVDAETRFMGGVESFDDLEREMRVQVAGVEGEDGALLARLVSVPLPREQGQRAMGRVVSVSGVNLTIETRDGEELRLRVDDGTRFLGEQVGSLDEIEEGMGVMVVYREEENGQLTALAIAAGQVEGQKALGQVVSVSGDSLTFTTRDGTELTVFVTGETRFIGEGVEGLDDLEAGQRVLVVFQPLEDGRLQARAIASGTPRGLEDGR